MRWAWGGNLVFFWGGGGGGGGGRVWREKDGGSRAGEKFTIGQFEGICGKPQQGWIVY